MLLLAKFWTSICFFTVRRDQWLYLILFLLVESQSEVVSYHFEPPSADVTTLNVGPRISEWPDHRRCLRMGRPRRIWNHLNAFEAAPDTVIFPEGDLTRCIILVDGTVEILKSTESLEKSLEFVVPRRLVK